jgi:hypothetical protein
MPVVNNGTVAYGSYVITVSGVGYVAENVNPTIGSTVLERFDELNAPSGQVLIPTFETATMTLQRATATSALPTIGSLAVGGTASGIVGSWFVSESSGAYEQGSIQKVNVTVRKAV